MFNKDFLGAYATLVRCSVANDHDDNHDRHRFGREENRPSIAFRIFRWLTLRLGLLTGAEAKSALRLSLTVVAPNIKDLEWLYAKLADDESRRWLVFLTAYRSLGHRKIKLPTNTPEFRRAEQVALQIPCGIEEIDPQFLGWKLHERNLEPLGYPIRMFCGPGTFCATFVHEQYRCETPEGAIEVSEGDIAVDAGACYGDTALYFAHKVGPTGRVAAFEFLPLNVSVFHRNAALNPDLAGKIRLYENPVYSESGRNLFVIANGPGTRVVPTTSDPTARAVQTLAIDELVSSGDFPRIDFIKMDIEGAELQALKGSEKILRQFKPKLAITVYHDFKDFWVIPQYLDSLGLGYGFYLRHFTIHAEETVLFAKCF